MKNNFIMEEKVNDITILIEKFLEEDLNQEEQRKLDEWLQEHEDNRLFFKQITNKQILKEKLRIYSNINSDTIWQKTLKKMGTGRIIDLYPRTKSMSFPGLSLFRWLAAKLANK